MFRLIHYGYALPVSIPVDPSAEFEAGMVGQLTLFGNQTVCGVSDGSAPLGIIDDMKMNAFSSVSIDEEVIAPVVGVQSGGQLVSSVDVLKELEHANVIEGSFMSNPVDIELIAKNGVVVFLAGTPLNYSTTGGSTYDAIRTVVSYSYRIPNIPGDDSTINSGMVTIWYMPMILSTTMYETNQVYPLNAPLFISESGLFTTRRIDPTYPAVGIVTGVPTAITTGLEVLWR